MNWKSSDIPVIDLAELRTAAEKLREWAGEIRRENTPAPYKGADDDIRMLEKGTALLDQAAEEILRLRALLKDG